MGIVFGLHHKIEIMNELMNRTIGGNTILSYLVVIGVILLSWIILKLVRKKLVRTLKKLTSNTSNQFDDMIVNAVDQFILPYTFLFINYTVIHQLALADFIYRVFEVAAMLVSAYF